MPRNHDIMNKYLRLWSSFRRFRAHKKSGGRKHFYTSWERRWSRCENCTKEKCLWPPASEQYFTKWARKMWKKMWTELHHVTNDSCDILGDCKLHITPASRFDNFKPVVSFQIKRKKTASLHYTITKMLISFQQLSIHHASSNKI